MKKGIHPEYYEATVRCACGNTFKSGSTKQELRVEFVRSVTHFIQGNRGSLSVVDVLKNSRKNMVWINFCIKQVSCSSI